MRAVLQIFFCICFIRTGRKALKKNRTRKHNQHKAKKKQKKILQQYFMDVHLWMFHRVFLIVLLYIFLFVNSYNRARTEKRTIDFCSFTYKSFCFFGDTFVCVWFYIFIVLFLFVHLWWHSSSLECKKKHIFILVLALDNSASRFFNWEIMTKHQQPTTNWYWMLVVVVLWLIRDKWWHLQKANDKWFLIFVLISVVF